MAFPVGIGPKLVRCLRGLLLSVLVVFAGVSGPAHAGPFDGTIYSVLSNTDQAKVLNILKDELLAVQAGQSAKADEDARASKTFAQLLDEVYHPTKKTAWQKYSSKYAGLAYSAATADPEKFARMAGAASAGDYGLLQAELPRIGAVVFAYLVSDALDDKGLQDAKYVWDTVVKRAGNLRDVGVAFMNGETDLAYDLAKKQVLSELKGFTETSVAGAIDWVFSEAGISPGKLYVEVIKSEVEFIKWSEAYLANDFVRHCIKSYLSEYNDTQSTYLALQHYERCTTLGGGAFAERVFANLLEKAELDPQTEVLPMLEAYRKQETFNPHNFYLDLYQDRIAVQEAALAAELSVAQTELEAAAETFAAALGQRLAALAQEMMSEEDREALTGAAIKAIADSQKQIEAIRKASKLALTMCETFNAAKDPFSKARAEMKRYSSIGYGIDSGLAAIPDCKLDGSYLLDDLVKARALKDTLDSAAADALFARDQVCAAKDSIATASDKSEALQFVQDARDAAGKAATAVENGITANAAYLPLLKSATEYSSTSLMNMSVAWTRKQFSELDAEMAILREAVLKAVEAQFAQAREQMNSAQSRARSLVYNAENWFEQVQVALAPYRSGPMGSNVKALLASLKQALEPAQLCEYRVRDDWHSVADPTAKQSAWERRKIDDTPDLAALEAELLKKRQACSELFEDTAATDRPDLEIIRMYSDVDIALSYLERAKREYDLCFALAAVAYSTQWSNQPEDDEANPPPITGPLSDPPSDPADLVAMPKVIGLAGDAAAELLLAVGLGANVEVQGAADTLAKKPGHVHTASAAPGDMLPKGTVVTLSTYDTRPVIEVPIMPNLTPADAKARLQAVGLSFAGIALGDPAPSDAETGRVYATSPAHPTTMAMFSPVTLVVYGPPKVTLLPVPNLANKSVQNAAGILASYGPHFVAGPLALGPDRPDGVNTGDVHFTDPPAGQLVPSGTVVTFYVYPPQEAPTETLAETFAEIPAEIIGMPAGAATTLLRGVFEDLFVVSAPVDGDAAGSGETPGTVQYSVPAAGTMAPKGSTVQLYVFREAEKPAEMSMQACPATNPDTSSYRHRIDSNNNPDDRTYLDCSYFTAGALRTQIPYTDGEFDGVRLGYIHWPKCGGVNLTSKMIFDNAKRVQTWTYLCDAKTGQVYKLRETTYADGKETRLTQWRANGALDHVTTYDPPGRIKRTLYYNSQGEYIDCRDRNANGTAIPCK